MVDLRRLAGLGLFGVLSATSYGADTEYTEMSRPAITQVLRKESAVLDERNFQKEVLDYDGAVIVQFDSTCNKTQSADDIDKNQDIVYLELIDKFEDAKVNNLPLKFAYFDGCGTYAQLPNGFFAEIGVTTTETHMYLDGRKIDTMKGGPISEKGIKAFDTNMSLWIEYTLLGIKQPEDNDKDVIALYRGTLDLESYPRSELYK